MLPLAWLGLVVCLWAGLGESARAAQGSPADEDAEGAVHYELRVSEGRRDLGDGEFSGAPALLLNGSSPGPVLTLREGQRARIEVHNDLEHEETSIHWHGLLLPNLMDGVPYLTTPPIPPGESRVFEFTLRQSGTYWYHSHTGLQEQQGVYGAIVVLPEEPLPEDVDHAVVLSDWTEEPTHVVMNWLMRGSDWYSIRKGTRPTLWGALENDAWGAYWEREASRMPPMDLSDVAYDAFLMNGQRRASLDAGPGETVRLRFVNAGASTYFFLSSSLPEFEIVAADGLDVTPVGVPRLLMGMAETYDVRFRMPADGAPVEFRASAQDGTGSATLRVGGADGRTAHAPEPPQPDRYRMDAMLAAGLASTRPEREAQLSREARPVAPYALLESTEPEPWDPDAPVRELTLRLTGDMATYRWGFDNRTLSEDPTIPLVPGEQVRLELINDTMMHHPLHLHGHFFRVVNGKGERAPWKHTVDVPPMGRRTVEFVASEETGDWFFHCHLLYHMDAGMARIFQYPQGDGSYAEPQVDPKLINPWFITIDASALTNMSMGQVRWMQGRNRARLNWMGDWGQEPHHRDREFEAVYDRYQNPNLSWFAGLRAIDDEFGSRERGIAGVGYRLPYLIQTRSSIDTDGEVRIEASKSLALVGAFDLNLQVQYDSETLWDGGALLSWALSRRLDLIGGYGTEHGWGVGVTVHF
jgi:FtsP/CotA-like multicopper oxidase with cupredoxin domain